MFGLLISPWVLVRAYDARAQTASTMPLMTSVTRHKSYASPRRPHCKCSISYGEYEISGPTGGLKMRPWWSPIRKPLKLEKLFSKSPCPVHRKIWRAVFWISSVLSKHSKQFVNWMQLICVNFFWKDSASHNDLQSRYYWDVAMYTEVCQRTFHLCNSNRQLWPPRS